MGSGDAGVCECRDFHVERSASARGNSQKAEKLLG
jgi:hypothetical protein